MEVVDIKEKKDNLDEYKYEGNIVLRVREEMHNSKRVERQINSGYLGSLTFLSIHEAFSKFWRSPATRIVHTFLDLLADIAFCILYIVEVHTDDKTNVWYMVARKRAIWGTAVILSIYTITSFLIRLTLARNKIQKILNIKFVIDMLTSAPFLASFIVEASTSIQFYIPYFLRSWLVNLRIQKVVQLNEEYRFFKIRISYFTERVIKLCTSLGAIIYSAMCAVQWSEFVFSEKPEDRIDLFTAFYFIIVTISTVGYGDVAPKTTPTKVFILILILTTLVVIPTLLGDLLDAISSRRSGGGSLRSLGFFRKRYIVLISMSEDNENHIIDMLYHLMNDDCGSRYNVSLFCNHELSIPLKEFLRRPKYAQAVTYIRGTITHNSLKRAGLAGASACFMLPAPCENEKMPDLDSILQLLTINTIVPEVPLFIHITTQHAEKFVCPPATEVVCLNELKQILLGYNTLFEGTSTLVTNLLIQSNLVKKSNKSTWADYYSDGLLNDFYSAKVVPAFVGKTFAAVSWFLFMEFQIIAIAVYVQADDDMEEDKNEDLIMLNPGRKYRFQKGDQFIYISQNEDFLDLIPTYSMEEVSKRVNEVDMLSFERNLKSKQLSLIKRAEGEEAVNLSKLAVMPYQPPYDLPMYQEPPLCVQQIQPLSFEYAHLSETDNLSGHLVILSTGMSLFTYLSTIRSGYLDLKNIIPIVIMVEQMPKKEDWDAISNFPKVYFMVGDSMAKDDLIRIGVTRASTVIIDYTEDASIKSRRFSDARAVVTYNLISSLVDQDETRIITCLESRLSANFFRTNTEQRLAKSTDDIDKERWTFLHSSAYASGRIIVPNMLDSILVTSWVKPFTVDLLKLMCGFRYTRNIRKIHEMTGNPHNVHLASIALPAEYVKKTFGDLFVEFLFKHDALPIGLLRKDVGIDNSYPFVYTNPLPSTVLCTDDIVYVLLEDA